MSGAALAGLIVALAATVVLVLAAGRRAAHARRLRSGPLSLLQDRGAPAAATGGTAAPGGTDGCTGLPDRAALAHELTAALSGSGNGSEGPVVLFVEVCTDGPLARDEDDAVAIEVSRRLVAAAGPNDHVSRFGPDQFVVVARGPAGEDGAGGDRAEAIGRALDGPLELPGRGTVRIAARIGVARPWAEDTALNLLRRAQQDLPPR